MANFYKKMLKKFFQRSPKEVASQQERIKYGRKLIAKNVKQINFVEFQTKYFLTDDEMKTIRKAVRKVLELKL